MATLPLNPPFPPSQPFKLPFNIHAFTRPSNRAEVSALLDEVLLMAGELDDMIDGISDMLAANAAANDARGSPGSSR